MPVLNYKPELASKVIDGSKPHTIRLGDRWKVGQNAIHATGARTKNYREIRRDQVTRVDSIEIEIKRKTVTSFRTSIRINGETLKPSAVVRLALRDGFSGPVPFYEFFRRTYGTGTHRGQLIQWGSSPVDYLNL